MKCRARQPGGKDRTGHSLTPAVLSRTPVRTLLPLLLCLLGFAAPVPAQVQLPDHYPAEGLENRARIALSQNVADYLMLGTLNAELQYSVHRSWTLQAGTRYNNWTWLHRQEGQFESRRQTYYAGARWWPWYTYSGWWAGARVQYEEYNRGGIVSPETEEGDAFGLGLGAGYAVHINHWLNADFGLYGWGGMTRYVSYACPYCGKRTGAGTKPFLLPDEVRIALQFIF